MINKLKNFRKEFDPAFHKAVKKVLLEQYSFSENSKIKTDKQAEQAILEYCSGGKRVRPFILSEFSGKSTADQSALGVMLACEFFHLAALIHDDLIDHAHTRRNSKTIHHALKSFADQYPDLGEAYAILYGDLFLIESFSQIQNTGPECINEFAMMQKRTLRGQFFDIQDANSHYGSTSESDIFLRHKLKTAHYTFTSPAILGLLLNEKNLSKNHYQEVLSVMTEIGMLFQIRDDLLDLECRTGKEQFKDIREGQTSWVALILKDNFPDKFERLLMLQKSKDSEAIEALFSEVDLSSFYEKEFQKKLEITQQVSEDNPFKETLKHVLDMFK